MICYNDIDKVQIGIAVKPMALENLYQLSEEQCRRLPRQLSEAFFAHPLFCASFPDETTRKECIAFFMTHYLQMLKPYAMFLADSEEMNAVMVVYDSRRFERKAYWQALLRMDLKLLYIVRLLGIRRSIRFAMDWDAFSKRWVRYFERNAYFHLELLYAKEEKKNTLVNVLGELIDEGDIMDMNISVKASDKESALWYERMGFVLMNTIVDEESGLHQYCLIARHHKEQKSWIQDIG